MADPKSIAGEMEGDYGTVKVQLAGGPAADAVQRPTKGTQVVWGGTAPGSPWAHLAALIEQPDFAWIVGVRVERQDFFSHGQHFGRVVLILVGMHRVGVEITAQFAVRISGSKVLGCFFSRVGALDCIRGYEVVMLLLGPCLGWPRRLGFLRERWLLSQGEICK